MPSLLSIKSVIALLFFLLHVISSPSAKAESGCKSETIVLENQAEVDSFQESYGPCDVAQYIRVRDLPNSYSLNDIDIVTDITNLDGLSGLKTIF